MSFIFPIFLILFIIAAYFLIKYVRTLYDNNPPQRHWLLIIALITSILGFALVRRNSSIRLLHVTDPNYNGWAIAFIALLFYGCFLAIIIKMSGEWCKRLKSGTVMTSIIALILISVCLIYGLKLYNHNLLGQTSILGNTSMLFDSDYWTIRYPLTLYFNWFSYALWITLAVLIVAFRHLLKSIPPGSPLKNSIRGKK